MAWWEPRAATVPGSYALGVDVTIVGAGVVGLTTALSLERRGHRVRIVAAGTGEAITSSVAGAVWFPYRAGPPAKVAAWAAQTRDWLDTLVGERAAGVDALTGYEITRPDERQPGVEGARPPDAATAPGLAQTHADDRPWWAANIAVDRVPAPVTGAPLAWRFAAPRVEPSLFLPWLARQVRAPIEPRTVWRLADEPGDIVVNCTGLAARELAGDDKLYPLFGQTVIVEPGGVDRTVTITDDREPDRIFYLIPRRDELVLGGCSIPYPPGAPPEPNPGITTRILDQARALGLPIGAVKRVRVGLRPYRLEVRLERDPSDPRIVHSYGHGGAGYTLAHGCAEEVAALVEAG